MNHLMDAQLMFERAQERVEPIRQQRELERLLPQQTDSWLVRLWVALRMAVAGQTANSARLQPVKVTSQAEDPCPAG